MSAAAKPQLSQAQLWMIWSVEKGYHTAKGWAHSPAYAHLFSQAEAGAFIAERTSKDPNALLLALHYDSRIAHNDSIRVIGQKLDRPAFDIAHLNSVARAAIKNLRLDKHEAAVVQVVGERSAASSDGHLDMLAIRTLHNHAVRSINFEPAEYVRRFNAALERYDRAFEAYRDRVQAAHRR